MSQRTDAHTRASSHNLNLDAQIDKQSINVPTGSNLGGAKCMLRLIFIDWAKAVGLI